MPQAPQIEKQPPSGLLACELERAECRECGREPSGPHSKFDSFHTGELRGQTTQHARSWVSQFERYTMSTQTQMKPTLDEKLLEKIGQAGLRPGGPTD
jgi:hypothetical protein